MRNEFEKLPEIEEGLRHCHYDESTGIYHADAAHVEEFEWHTQFVNGAWYAFQEQQKKIDAANTLKNDLNGLIDGFLCCEFMATKVDCVEFINGLKELLK